MLKQRNNFYSVLFLIIIGISPFCSCSSTKVPEKWNFVKIGNKGLIEIEKETDENGLYIKCAAAPQKPLKQTLGLY